MAVEHLDPLDVGFRYTMCTKCSLEQVMGDAVEGLFQVEECHVDWLAFFYVPVHEQASHLDGISCATTFDETALVGRDMHNLQESGVEDPFKNLWCGKGDRWDGSLHIPEHPLCPSRWAW